MNSETMGRVWAVVPAAGSGQRFGAGSPKQYASLAGRPLLSHTMDALASASLFAKVVVVLAADDTYFSDIPLPAGQPLVTVPGGDTRAASVLAGLEHLLLSEGADGEDWVLVHDAARPLLSAAVLARMYETLRDDAVGGLLAVPVHDTVKLAGDAAPPVVQQTLDRQRVWLAQTPQMFRLGLLRAAIDAALREAASGQGRVTDEASAMELAGHNVRIVEGEVQNIKVTTPADLELAEHYLRQQDKAL